MPHVVSIGRADLVMYSLLQVQSRGLGHGVSQIAPFSLKQHYSASYRSLVPPELRLQQMDIAVWIVPGLFSRLFPRIDLACISHSTIFSISHHSEY